MAQSVSCNLSNIASFSKSWNSNSNFRNSAKFSKFGRPVIGGVRAMAAPERKDNLDHLQKTGAVKRRETSSVPLVLWDRFPTARTVQQMLETMDRMIDEPSSFSSTSWPSPPPQPNGGYARGRTPWEIKEGKAEYKLRFDVPGMTKKDVKVWVEENMLVIKAEKIAGKKEENGGMVVDKEEEEDWTPRSFGKYSTRIALPEHVDFEKIKAEVRDGVLYVNIPKASPSSKVFDISVD